MFLKHSPIKKTRVVQKRNQFALELVFGPSSATDSAPEHLSIVHSGPGFEINLIRVGCSLFLNI